MKILLIEDNPADARLIRELLREPDPQLIDPPAFELLHADRLKSGLTYLNTIRFDVILLDLTLPDSENLDTFRQVHAVANNIPIVILTGHWNEELATQAVQQGAQDYLSKSDDLLPNLLIRSMRYAIERQRLRAQLEEKTKQLAINEAQRRAIIEHNPDGIILLNEESIVRFVNPAAEKILRTDREQLLGKPFHLPAAKGDTAELTVARNRGGSASIEIRLVETTWEGEKVLQASLRDVSEHATAKAAIKRRAEELSNQNRALDEFAHTMAHQVQGLLSQVIGYASYIQMHYAPQPEQSDLQRAIERIIQSGHKMDNVITELLLLASMRSGDVPIVPLDMGRVLNEVQKRLKFQIEATGALIEAPAEWPILMGHTSWIEEALLNYLSNAIKYGGTPPRIKLSVSDEANNMIKVSVQDNGIGISEDDQRRLFKPHTRLHQVEVRGDGLGLSIVRRIITRCQGEVGVESDPGKGSTFWFTLPRATTVDLKPMK